jgi:hypothetical protein
MNPATTALRRAFLIAVVARSPNSVTRASASGPARPVRAETMRTSWALSCAPSSRLPREATRSAIRAASARL